MVQQVDVDGEIHEFPDEATPEMMQAGLRMNPLANNLTISLKMARSIDRLNVLAQIYGTRQKELAIVLCRVFLLS